MNLLSNRLLNQGYKKPTILETTSQALKKYCQPISTSTKQKSETTNKPQDSDSLRIFYYQLPYHRRGVQRQQIQRAYKKHISPHLPHPLTIAFNRPTNLKDQLCKSTLPDIPGNNPSDFLKLILQERKRKETT